MRFLISFVLSAVLMLAGIAWAVSVVGGDGGVHVVAPRALDAALAAAEGK